MQFGLISLVELVPRIHEANLTKRFLRFSLHAVPFYYVIYPFIFLKTIISIALYSEELAPYRWLDCQLLGRFQVSSRVPEASKYILAATVVYQVGLRFELDRLGEALEIPFVDFVMLRHADVIRWFAQMRRGHRRRSTSGGGGGDGDADEELPPSPLRRLFPGPPSFRRARPTPTPSLRSSSVRSSNWQREQTLREQQAKFEGKCGHSMSSARDAANGYLRLVRLASFESVLAREPEERQFIVRPNRSPESHLLLASLTVWCVWFFSFGFGITFAFQSAMLMTVTLTQRGFIQNYANCAKWISSSSSSSSSAGQEYEHIYRPSVGPHTLALGGPSRVQSTLQEVPFFMPLADFVPLNGYHTARILADFGENLLVFLDIMITYQLHLTLLVLISVDVLLYAGAIRDKLTELNTRLAAHNFKAYPNGVGQGDGQDGDEQDNSEFDGDESDGPPSGEEFDLPSPCLAHLRPSMLTTCAVHPSSRITSPVGRRPWLQQTQAAHRHLFAARRRLVELSPCHELITETQALIQDYFNLISKYNNYVSLIVFVDTIISCMYTWNIFFRYIMPERLRAVAKINREVQIEFLFIFVAANGFVLFLQALAALVESHSRRLYPLLASSMALDRDVERTKLRWLKLMRYYHPKDMYCFSLFNQIRVSWLLMLKIVAWVVSTLIVVKNLAH